MATQQTRTIDPLPLPDGVDQATLDALDAIQQRVLWLSTNIVHHANNLRDNPDGTKVGGHQASSASIVSVLVALYFHFLREGDRVAIKPHASPAYHGLQYLLGMLDRRYLPTLRQFGGLQAYPSRTKDPDPVDFSTGSVGLGVAAPAFAALAERYARLHFGGQEGRRFIALAGDAELDEGNVWEAVTEVHLSDLGNVIWIVDLNRQSLDRVVPGIRSAQLQAIFRDSNWHVVEAKYGRKLQAAFARPGGEVLRHRIDSMSNQEYQAAIRLPGNECREALLRPGDYDHAVLERLLADYLDDDLPGLLSDLGGHDQAELLRCLQSCDAETSRPSVLFAYTIKGWGLPMAGHPLNHSALMSTKQVQELAPKFGIDLAGDEWPSFPPDSPEGRVIEEAAIRLGYRQEGGVARTRAHSPLPISLEDIPESIGHQPLPQASTQATLGLLLLDLSRLPKVAERIVTVSPDVAVSTNLGGWINKVGVYAPTREAGFEHGPLPVKWQPSPSGQHIELGISEMNLFLVLEQLGLGPELFDQLLLPVGTVYDPFVLRGLDAFIHALYSHSRFIVAGTPAGVSLAPEGGAHQSTVTPALGMGLPNLNAWEPAFAREVEWILLDGLRQCLDRQHGRSTYLRLSTKPMPQALLEPALARLGEAELRRQVLSGGYRLVDWRTDAPDCEAHDVVQIAAAGIMIPEAVQAARLLHEEGVAANVLAITSADLLYRAMKEDPAGLGHLVPADERRAPMVTVIDGASHSLSFLGGAWGVPVVSLGVDGFGQSGLRDELYRSFGMAPDQIAAAAFEALDRANG